MSQLEDINAIDAMFNRTKPANPTSAALRSSWIAWFKTLRPYDKSSSPGAYKEAVKRRDEFFRAEEAGPVKTVAPTAAPVTPSTTIVAVPPAPRPVIKRGSTGTFVTAWQRIIGVGADGKFGSGTETATKAWQKARGLTADGIVGNASWARAEVDSQAAMNRPTSIAQAATQAAQQVAAAMSAPAPIPAVAGRPTLRRGSSGEYVKQWQRIIAVTADGQFGPGTEAATKTWQASRGLTADGIVGPNTWAKAQTASGTPLTPAQVVQTVANTIAASVPTPVRPSTPTPARPPAATTPAAPRPSVVETAQQYISSATPPAVKETVAVVSEQLATLNAKTPVWMKAMGVAGAALSALIGFKVLGGKKRTA